VWVFLDLLPFGLVLDFFSDFRASAVSSLRLGLRLCDWLKLGLSLSMFRAAYALLMEDLFMLENIGLVSVFVALLILIICGVMIGLWSTIVRAPNISSVGVVLIGAGVIGTLSVFRAEDANVWAMESLSNADIVLFSFAIAIS